MTPNEKRAFQEAFWRRAGRNLRVALEMLGTIPGAAYYVKDAAGRFVAANRRNLDVCGIANEGDVIGLTSADIFPAPLAREYMALDRQVLESGIPVVETTESPTGDYSTDRLVKSVFPVWADAGQQEPECIGTMCAYVQTPSPDAIPEWRGRLKDTIEWIDANLEGDLSVEALARKTSLSPKKLEAAFSALFGIGVARFVATKRLSAARRLLENTGKSISEIAAECGFFDHSHLIKAFRGRWGVTPGQYRGAMRGRHRRKEPGAGVEEGV
ncbi:MAG: helix-turn-helix domain-containing protein [Kiritimatiellae bacterium]|nr:helix-turn-helix domain-containing protein [Kiritimatiellia bacterium]